MNEPSLGIFRKKKATSVRADSRRQSPYPRHTGRRDPHALIPYRQPTPRPRCTHLQLLMRTATTLDTSRTPHPPVLAPRRPQTSHSSLAPPRTHPAPTPAHASHTALTFRALHPPCRPPHAPCIRPTHLADSGAAPHTWHIPQTPHPFHAPRARHRPRSHHAHTPRSPRAHRRLRVRRARLAAEPRLLPEEPPASAPPGGAGGKRRLRRAPPTPRFGGGSSSSRGRGRELLATLHGPRSPAPPARFLSPAPRLAGDPKTPASGHAAGLARRSPLPFSPLTASRHLPQRCSRSETHSSAPAADTDSAEAAAGALRS